MANWRHHNLYFYLVLLGFFTLGFGIYAPAFELQLSLG